MPKLNFHRNHTLSMADASAQLKAMVDEFVGKYSHLVKSVDWSNDGSTMKAKGKGFKGEFKVSATRVDVELDLGLVAIPMKGRIEQSVNERLDAAFGG